MAQNDGYQPQVGIGGAPALSGVSPDAFGAGLGASIENAGQTLESAADRAHKIETDQAREAAWYTFTAGRAEAATQNDAYFEQAKSEAPPGQFKDYVLNDFDERQSNLLPADPKVAQHAAAQIAEDRAELEHRADIFQRGQIVAQQAEGFTQTGNTLLNAVSQAGSPADRIAAMTRASGQYEQMLAGAQNLDPVTKAKELDRFHGDVAEMGIRSALTAGDVQSAGQLLDSDYAKGALPPEKMAALYNEFRVTRDRLTSQAKAANTLAFTGAIKGLDLTAQQYTQGRPSFDEANGLSAQYQAVAATATTPEQKATALEKAQTWHATATEIGASEAYRGQPLTQINARVQELAAKQTRTPEEGAELKGLEGLAAHVGSLPTLARYTFATGKGVPPIDWSDPASIQQRNILWQSAQQQFGGSPDFLLPGEEQPLHEIVRSGTPAQKVAAMQSVMSLPGPAAQRVLNAVAPDDSGFKAAATLAGFADGGWRMQRALQGQAEQQANKTLWERQKDPTGKHYVGPTHEQLWASYAPALAGLPAAYVQDLRENTFNLYAASAKDMGWHDFKPDELGRSLRFALGGGKLGAVDAGGLGTHNGAQVLLPNGVTQSNFDQRIARASGADWGNAAINGPAMVGNRPAFSGDLRSWVPVMVDPGRGLYAMRQGNSFVQAQGGKRYLFDIHKLP